MSAASLPRAFFDTNVLVYADDERSPIKQAKAREQMEVQEAHAAEECELEQMRMEGEAEEMAAE